MHEIRHRPQIADAQVRIGRRLQPHQPRVRPQRGFDITQLGRVCIRELEAIPFEHALEKTVRAAVHVASGHDVVARREQAQHRVGGGHARGKGQPMGTALQRCQAGLERGASGVAGARILVTAMTANTLLGEGRSLVDRRHQRAARGIWILPGVYGLRLKFHPDPPLVSQDCDRTAPASAPPRGRSRVYCTDNRIARVRIYHTPDAEPTAPFDDPRSSLLLYQAGVLAAVG